MIQQVLAIHDRKANAYMRPIFAPTIAFAIRLFNDEVNRKDPTNLMNTHSGDFTLYHLGEWNDDNGSFFQQSVPQQVAIGEHQNTDTFNSTQPGAL